MTRSLKTWWLALPLLLVALGAQAAKIRITVEALGGVEQYVYLSRPAGLAPDRPVVFVIHGLERDADEYRDQWHDLAEDYDFLLVAPEFSDRDFPGADWSFPAIEPVFDEVRKRFGMKADGYALYGHSAGARFVHRFLFHVPKARVTRAVVANAGWYTMPDFSIEYPYGLKDSAVSREMLKKAMQRPLTILLGEEDTDPEHPSLRRTPEALAQGLHRFARGQAFFAAGQATARDLGVPFAWQLVTVPGADHDNRLMAPAAMPYLLESEPQ